MTKTIGYARVSTKEQNEDRQIIALTEYGVSRENIWLDKASGKDFERKNYKKMLKTLKKGDVLVIKSIDRLGRNYEEIIAQWRHITKEKGADIVILDMQILNTTQHKDLLGTLIADIVLQILSYVSQSEREAIRQRQAEGIAAAKAKGVHFGRKKEYTSDEYTEVFEKYRRREIDIDTALKTIGCGKSTFYHMLCELRKNGKIK